MKREIKFRAWRTKDKSMAYNIDIDRNGKVPGAFASRDWPVMQYTGLKDKNGKEIYEGDWIKISEGDKKLWISVICFRHSMFCLVNNKCSDHIDNGIGPMCSLSEAMYLGSIQVIGNIYEKPELINQQEREMNKIPQDKARLEGDIYDLLKAFMEEHNGLKRIDIETQFIENLGKSELMGARVTIEI